MEIEKIYTQEAKKLDRMYIATGILKTFMGHSDVEFHLFRHGGTDEELEAIRGLELVTDADPAMPSEFLAGATEEAALRCILEAFTEEEAEQLCTYLQEHYGEQITKLTICPLPLPVPLGVGPLSAIPESKKSGFINFDQAAIYNLPFKVKAYYDTGA